MEVKNFFIFSEDAESLTQIHKTALKSNCKIKLICCDGDRQMKLSSDWVFSRRNRGS